MRYKPKKDIVTLFPRYVAFVFPMTPSRQLMLEMN
jgi:hypothetical protein